MITESQIREHIASFLAGEESLDAFEDWLVQNSWNMHRDSSEAAQQLVAEIELRLSEYSSGHLDEGALRNELRSFVEWYREQISFSDSSIPGYFSKRFAGWSQTIRLELAQI